MRTLVLAILVIVGLLAFGCLQAQKPTAPEISPIPEEQEISKPPVTAVQESGPCANEENVFSSDECFLAYAKSSKNSSYCEQIYAITTRDDCYVVFAKTDARLCAKLAASSARSACYYDYARASNDTDYCVKISDTGLKQKCLVGLSPPCSFEPDENSKALCLATYHNASSFCKNEDCLFSLGTGNKNIAACDEISNSSRALRSACRAVVMDDASVCKESGLDVVADYCYQLAAYSANRSAWCTLTTTGSPYALQCLMHFASKNNEPSLCRFANSELDRDNCYMNYSITNGNHSTCDLIKVSILDSQCRISTALTHGDMSSCNKLMYSSRTNCYNLVLNGKVQILSEASCIDVVDDDPWEYRCLVQYAQQVNDPSICSKIGNSKYKQDCEFRFS